MKLLLITDAALEPVTLQEAKNHLKIDADMTEDDTLIVMLIGAARCYAEGFTGRALITQTWQGTLDNFPGYVIPGAALSVSSALRNVGSDIYLRKSPVKSITSVSYMDTDGNWQTMPAPDYVFDPSGIVQRLSPAYGKSWPATRQQIANVRITFTAGYGAAASDVPENFRHWMLLRIGTLYANREEVAIMTRGKVDPLPFVDSLLDYLKVPVI